MRVGHGRRVARHPQHATNRLRPRRHLQPALAERPRRKLGAGCEVEPFEEPAIPWQEMVRRLQSLQDITLQAMRDSTNILLDSTKSSMKAVHDAAQTVAQATEQTAKTTAAAEKKVTTLATQRAQLTAQLGVALIRGLQAGHQACAVAKHFAVHSGPEGLRHSFDAGGFVMTVHQDCKRRNYCLIRGAKIFWFTLKNVESLPRRGF